MNETRIKKGMLCQIILQDLHVIGIYGTNRDDRLATISYNTIEHINNALIIKSDEYTYKLVKHMHLGMWMWEFVEIQNNVYKSLERLVGMCVDVSFFSDDPTSEVVINDIKLPNCIVSIPSHQDGINAIVETPEFKLRLRAMCNYWQLVEIDEYEEKEA